MSNTVFPSIWRRSNPGHNVDAAAAVDFVGLRHATSHNGDAGIQCEAVALGSVQFKAYPVTPWNSTIAQDHRAAVDVADDNIHVPVIEQVAHRGAARPRET